MGAAVHQAQTPSTAEHSQNSRRADIQALRAVAALLVVVFHLWPSRLTGGYIGVDVFFVISGYLITAHLLRESGSRGRVDLARFWARRARRLLPSALLVLAVTAIAVWRWVPQIHFVEFYKGIAASALYVENWSLARDAVDYLAEDNAASPTQHYWTLSVEEQFYLIWPLLVLLGLAMARRWRVPAKTVIFVILGLCTVGSFGFSLYFTQASPAQAFFATPARAWEFGAGALLAFVPAGTLARIGGRRGAIAAWLGLAVILWCGFSFDASTPMPGTAAAVVVLGAVVFIACGGPAPHRGAPGALLDVRPVQFTGDISYSLYLWHWPLIILLPFIQGHPNGQRTLVAILIVTFVLAAFSTFWVENPIRFSQRPGLRNSGPTLVIWLTAAAVLAGVSLSVVHQENEAAQRDKSLAAQFAADPPRCAGAASIDPEVPCVNPDLDRILVPSIGAASRDRAKIEGQSCASRPVGATIKPCFGGDWADRSLPHVAVIGDSHARMMTTTLERLADEGVLAWKGYFQSGCVWTTDPAVRVRYIKECQWFKKELPTTLAPDIDDIDFAITTGRVSKLDGTADQAARGLQQAWRTFTDRGIPVVALSDVPEIGPANDCLARHARDDVDECARRAADVLTSPDPFLRAAELSPLTVGIDMHPYYCADGLCPVVVGGVIVYSETNHLTATYASTLAPLLERELTSKGLLPAS